MTEVTLPSPAEIQAFEAKARQMRADVLRNMLAALRQRVADALHIGGRLQHN